MTRRVRQCARLVRVRTIQHNIAAVSASRAARQVEALEASSHKLASLRIGFGAEPGQTSGSALASLGELAMRLDVAREGLKASIVGARRRASLCREVRMAAQRDQESAERLTEKAAIEESRKAEKQQAQRPFARRRIDVE